MSIQKILDGATKTSSLDQRALKVLLQYSPLASAKLSDEDKDVLITNGLFLGEHNLDHDEVVEQAKAVALKVDKTALAGNFLAGFGGLRPELMGGLIAYAIVRQMPLHLYSSSPAGNCLVCCCFANSVTDLTFCNSVRYSIGALVNTDVYHLWFHLEMALRISSVLPSESDADLFRRVIQGVLEVGASAKPKDLISVIRKQFKKAPNAERIRQIIDSLGALSILESEKHKGFYQEYTNLGLAPSKSRSSDWAYPVDWWTGANGVNENAVNFWFGNFI